jgi:hypothetical protein
MRNLNLITLGVCLLTLAGCSAAAKDGIGQIEAEIGGEDYHGITLGKTSEHAASAELMTMGPMTMVSMQAHDLDTGGIMDNVVNLKVSLMGASANAQIIEAEVSYWPEGMGSPFYISTGANVPLSIEWDRLEVGEEPFAAGSFSGELCLQADFYTPADTTNCKSITGTFSSALVVRN